MTKSKIDGMETASNLIAQGHRYAMLPDAGASADDDHGVGGACALRSGRYGERHEERGSNTRNGYRERVLETRVGTAELQFPKLRTGSYLPCFLEPRRRWEQAFVSVISEAYVKGVSTRESGRSGEGDGSYWDVEERGVAAVHDA